MIASALAIAAGGTSAQQPTPAPPANAIDANFSVTEQSIFGLQNAMQAGRTTSRRLVELYLERIAKYDQAGPKLNAFIALNSKALDEASALDAERRAGRVRGALHGIPVVVKDNYATADMPTTAGSRALAEFRPDRDAFMVKKLRDAGAVIIGKTNLHELAYGITSISSMGGQTLNPYDLTRNPGGSSGGTGAAVAANFAAAGLGTDTCGSIRNPASSNNLFGLRPTQGLTSRNGIVPLAHSQDIGGPLARNVTDLIIMFDATVGIDPDDPMTKYAEGRLPRTYLSFVGDSGLGDMDIGVFKPLFGSAAEDAEVTRLVMAAVKNLEALGATIVDVDMSDYQTVMQNTSTINAEFKFDLMDFFARYPKTPVKSLADIIATGKYHPAVEDVLKRSEAVASRDSDNYKASLAKRDLATDAIVAVMARTGVDALIYPTLRRKPAVIGQGQGGSNCQLSATTGMPAMSIPAGFTDDGLPVGMDLLGRYFSEPQLLKIAYAYEQLMNPRKAPRSTP